MDAEALGLSPVNVTTCTPPSFGVDAGALAAAAADDATRCLPLNEGRPSSESESSFRPRFFPFFLASSASFLASSCCLAVSFLAASTARPPFGFAFFFFRADAPLPASSSSPNMSRNLRSIIAASLASAAFLASASSSPRAMATETHTCGCDEQCDERSDAKHTQAVAVFANLSC